MKYWNAYRFFRLFCGEVVSIKDMASVFFSGDTLTINASQLEVISKKPSPPLIGFVESEKSPSEKLFLRYLLIEDMFKLP